MLEAANNLRDIVLNSESQVLEVIRATDNLSPYFKSHQLAKFLGGQELITNIGFLDTIGALVDSPIGFFQNDTNLRYKAGI